MKSIFLSNGLTRRTAECLARLNVPMNKKAVIKAIQDGILYANCIPRHYGPQTHKEICQWAGISSSGEEAKKTASVGRR